MKDYQFLIKKIRQHAKKIRGSDIFFLLIPALLIAIFLNLFLFDQIIVKQTRAKRVLPVPFSIPLPAVYPRLHPILRDSIVSISALGAVVMDDESKVILFSKNRDTRFSMASTTKIMTALVALEHYNLNDVLTVKGSTKGTVIGFTNGEKFLFEDLLYAMMLPSANDAAEAIAQNYPGGKHVFVAKMNEKASLLHLSKTRFADPAGLEDGNYTTVVDLARLASEALKNPIISRIVATKQKVITDRDGLHKYVLTNLNQLLGIDGVNGIKTGFTDEAGGVLVTSKLEGTHTLIMVVMKSQNRFLDTRKLLYLVSGNTIYSAMDQ